MSPQDCAAQRRLAMQPGAWYYAGGVAILFHAFARLPFGGFASSDFD